MVNLYEVDLTETSCIHHPTVKANKDSTMEDASTGTGRSTLDVAKGTVLPIVLGIVLVMAIGAVLHAGPLNLWSPFTWTYLIGWPFLLALRVLSWVFGAFLWMMVPILLAVAWFSRLMAPALAIASSLTAVALILWLT